MRNYSLSFDIYLRLVCTCNKGSFLKEVSLCFSSELTAIPCTSLSGTIPAIAKIRLAIQKQLPTNRLPVPREEAPSPNGLDSSNVPCQGHNKFASAESIWLDAGPLCRGMRPRCSTKIHLHLQVHKQFNRIRNRLLNCCWP